MFSIISDEASDHYMDLCKKVPFPLIYREREVRLKNEEICELLEKGEIFRTSQVSVKRFLEEFKKMEEPIICITISKELSGTYNSAKAAARMSKKEVYVVDSGSASIGQGFIVEKAVELREKGYDAKEAVEEIEEFKKRIRLFFTLKDLSYLRRSGRISYIFSVIGDFFKVNPVMQLYMGKAKVVKVKRGYEKACMEIVNLIKKRGYEKALSGFICSRELGEKVSSSLKIKLVSLCPAFAAHLGPAVVVGIVEK